MKKKYLLNTTIGSKLYSGFLIKNVLEKIN